MTINLYLSPDMQHKLETLATQNGQYIEVVANNLFRQAVESIDQNNIKEMVTFLPNEKALAALRHIA